MNDTHLNIPPAGGGYQITRLMRFNAREHGVLSHYTILPWENESEHNASCDALPAEQKPHGPTEAHLVEELAGVIWRKRRLRLAEAAAHHRGLDDITSHRDTVAAALSHLTAGKPIERPINAILATQQKTDEELRVLDTDELKTERALKILRTSRPDAYEKALAALPKDKQEWWEDVLVREPDYFDEDEETFTEDATGLLRFLEQEVLPSYTQRRTELKHRSLIRRQGFGEAFDPDRLEKLSRYEVHLDRKLEKTLAMLIRLQELRFTANPE